MLAWQRHKVHDNMLLMKKYITSLFLLALSIVLLTPTSNLAVEAHGSGKSYETTVGGYFIDIGYIPALPVAPERARFDFTASLTDQATETGADFTDVWVTIKQGHTLIFSGNIHRPEIGPTGLNVTLPWAGEYEVKARFQAAGNKLAEANFPLVVIPGESENTAFDWVTLSAAFLAGCLLTLFGVIIYRRFYHG